MADVKNQAPENEPDKRNIAIELVEQAQAQYVVSTQVLGEFANTMIGKFGCEIESVKVAVQDFKANFEIAIIQPDTIDKALRLIEKHSYSYWDSVIISSALDWALERPVCVPTLERGNESNGWFLRFS